MWRAFQPDVPLLEIFLRGTVMYLGLIVLLRVLGRREIGSLGVGDMLTMVLLGDAAQNGMTGDHKSIGSGCVLVLTIVFWNAVLDWMSLRSAWVRFMLAPGRVSLIVDGRLQRHNLRSQMMTETELSEKLREHGIERPAQVHRAYLEPDGEVSVIPKTQAG